MLMRQALGRAFAAAAVAAFPALAAAQADDDPYRVVAVTGKAAPNGTFTFASDASLDDAGRTLFLGGVRPPGGQTNLGLFRGAGRREHQSRRRDRPRARGPGTAGPGRRRDVRQVLPDPGSATPAEWSAWPASETRRHRSPGGASSSPTPRASGRSPAGGDPAADGGSLFGFRGLRINPAGQVAFQGSQTGGTAREVDLPHGHPTGRGRSSRSRASTRRPPGGGTFGRFENVRARRRRPGRLPRAGEQYRRPPPASPTASS